MSIEAMKQALDALEDIFGKNKVDVGAINVLRQAIEQAEKQKPKRERIQELAIQAGLEFDDDSGLESEQIYYCTRTDLEKFAESIVQECINVIGESPCARETAMYYRKRLADHFGINNASSTTST